MSLLSSEKKATNPRTTGPSTVSQGREAGPRSGALPAGVRIQVEADRAGVCVRGEQVESRVVGKKSCVEAVVRFGILLCGLVCASHQQLPCFQLVGPVQAEKMLEGVLVCQMELSSGLAGTLLGLLELSATADVRSIDDAVFTRQRGKGRRRPSDAL